MGTLSSIIFHHHSLFTDPTTSLGERTQKWLVIASASVQLLKVPFHQWIFIVAVMYEQARMGLSVQTIPDKHCTTYINPS
jgi:hypothetical protein